MRPQRLRSRLLARTPLEACPSVGILLLVERATWKRSFACALAPAVRSLTLCGHAGVGNVIALLVRMAVCHASVNAWLALRRQHALDEFHSPAGRFRF